MAGMNNLTTSARALLSKGEDVAAMIKPSNWPKRISLTSRSCSEFTFAAIDVAALSIAIVDVVVVG